jgi:hypothetical protein
LLALGGVAGRGQALLATTPAPPAPAAASSAASISAASATIAVIRLDSSLVVQLRSIEAFVAIFVPSTATAPKLISPGALHSRNDSTNTRAVPVQQDRNHDRGVMGGAAVPVRAVGPVERCQVEVIDRVDHEPGQAIDRPPIACPEASKNRCSRSPVT